MTTQTTKQKIEVAGQEHFHRTPDGVLLACYHKCKTVISDWGFWIGMTIGFPLEHFLWERIWPFSYITEWMGL